MFSFSYHGKKPMYDKQLEGECEPSPSRLVKIMTEILHGPNDQYLKLHLGTTFRSINKTERESMKNKRGCS